MIKILGKVPITAIEKHFVLDAPDGEAELIMVEAWWPALERAVEWLDSGVVPAPAGAKRKLKAPAHMYSLFDDDPDHIEPWSPGEEELHRRYHAERHAEDGESPTSRLLLTARGLPDLFVALDYLRKQGGRETPAGSPLSPSLASRAHDMLEQWLDVLMHEQGIRGLGAASRTIKVRYLSHGHWAVSDQEAGRLARDAGQKLPAYGNELSVDLGHGTMAWLNRLPDSHGKGAPKRGWSWVVRIIDSRHALPANYKEAT